MTNNINFTKEDNNKESYPIVYKWAMEHELLNHKIKIHELLKKYTKSDIYDKYENKKLSKIEKLTDLMKNTDDRSEKTEFFQQINKMKSGLSPSETIGANIEQKFNKKSGLADKIIVEKKINSIFDKINNELDLNSWIKNEKITWYYNYLINTYWINNKYIDYKTWWRLKEIISLKHPSNIWIPSKSISTSYMFQDHEESEDPDFVPYNYWKAMMNDITWDNNEWDHNYENKNLDPNYR